jgi:hypothetical protein
MGLDKMTSARRCRFMSKRLRSLPGEGVGVYLTNYVTELFFRQFVGRVARNQGTEVDKEAYAYVPHHPTLMQFAQHIKRLP